jgi:hypothetical protein
MKTINIPGFEDQKISVQLAGTVGAAKLFINDQPAPSASKKGQYLLRRNDGTEVTAYFKGGFPNPIPVLMVDGQVIHIAKPLPWYQWVWICFPLVLVVLGGAIGGALGCLATAINMQIFQSQQNNVLKYVLSALVSMMAFVVFLVVAILLRLIFS